jgi:hypothetical protein
MIAHSTVRLVMTLLTAAMSVACAETTPEFATSAVPNPGTFLDHIRPADLGRDVDAIQLVSVSRDDAAVTIEVRLSVRPQELRFVAQDMIGQRLLTARWNGARVVEERSPNLPRFIIAKGLLADLVAICWPEKEVRQALRQAGANLSVQGNQRIVSIGDRESMRAVRTWGTEAPWTGRLSYRNVRTGYTVDIQSVEQP